MKEEKMSNSERQELIISMLKEAKKPITGNKFAKITNVSRQVIVQDISILKAKKEPIVATSQGYIYLQEDENHTLEQMVIVCSHTPEETQEELNILVDNGVAVKDVIVEHPVYGDLIASIRVSNRSEVKQFIGKINQTKSSYLLTLTKGLHLHTIEADSMEKLEAACEELEKAGFLVTDKER